MPESANYLAAYIEKFCQQPYTLVVVNNGSDLVRPSHYANLVLGKNIQTTGGWMAGLEDYIDHLQIECFAYCFMITSAWFIPPHDHISMMRDFLLENKDAVGIMPALTPDSDIEVWKQMLTRGGDKPRRTWGLDNIITMWRADWFNSIGRFDKRLVYAWGLAEETSWKARRDGKSLWIDERIRITKKQDIGYKMDRMNMTAEGRRLRGMRNVMRIMKYKYGENWIDKLTNEYVNPAWK